MSESLPASFGGLLRFLRVAAGLTQEELAEAASVSYRSISDLERGISKSPRRDTTRLLADALRLSGNDRARFEAVARGHVSAQSLPAGIAAATRARSEDLMAPCGEEGAGQVPALPGAVEPGGSGPQVPGRVPRIWNIPARNPGFTGRDGLLAAVRQMLLGGDRAVVHALHGMGGVGKTQLAVEYAYRFAGAYDLAWWVNAERGGLIGEQFAALGAALGCVPAGAGIEAVRSAVLAELRERGRWLLVFDNAEDPADVTGWLPGGGGHALVTSRARGWTEVAATIEVDVLARSESVAILHDRVTTLDAATADRLAAELGDLPLGVAQAAAFMAESGMPPAEYLELLRTRAGQLLAQVVPGVYPQSLAAATQITAARLASEDPAAATLAGMCAFLAPEPVPEDLFTGPAATSLPGRLAARAADPLAWRQTLARLSRRSLVRVDHRGLQMHRLTQAILRDQLTPEQAAMARAHAEAVLAASGPPDPANHPAAWPQWARLMPHVLAVGLTADSEPGLRRLACNACLYLLARGDISTGHDLAGRLHRNWRKQLGEDHEQTLEMAQHLGWALRVLGRYGEARDLDQDTLRRERQVLGEDHPGTLTTATNLAIVLRSLRELPAARDLAQDTLNRQRRVLGEDHVSTLRTANNLALVLCSLRELPAARDLARDTLNRRRQVLGEDHPDTLRTIGTLANCLRELGEVHAARDLGHDAWDRQRRVLGEDHPTTLSVADQLAMSLHALGEVEAARDLALDTLDRRRRVLGEDHPSTLATASKLTDYTTALGSTRKPSRNRPG